MQKKYYELKINENQKMTYIVYWPEKAKENMPLLLFLHGIGERGDNVEVVEKYAFPKYMNRFNIPYIVIAPQCTKNSLWNYHIRGIEEILTIVYKKYHYDKKRVCILGSSMGVIGAGNFIMTRPELFKGIVSIAGSIMLPLKKALLPLKDKGNLIYHGCEDNVIVVTESINAYKKLKEVGALSIELKIIENENHFLTSHAFKEKYLYE